MSRAKPIDKDPWCCASDKLHISVDSFDQGCLTSYKSLRHVVRALTKEEALQIIDEMIVELEQRRKIV